jgi:hypothetical protein
LLFFSSIVIPFLGSKRPNHRKIPMRSINSLRITVLKQPKISAILDALVLFSDGKPAMLRLRQVRGRHLLDRNSHARGTAYREIRLSLLKSWLINQRTKPCG